MVKLLKVIREIFFPLLEGDVPKPKLFNIESFKFSEEETDKLIEIAKEYQASEDARRKEVESKASIYIGTFAVATTIMLSLAKDFIKKEISVPALLTIVIVVVTIVYLCIAIIFSIKCLSRKKYAVVGFPEWLLTDKDTLEKKKKNFLFELLNAVKNNQNVINEKVDYMVMAQEYFKRAVVCVGVLAVLLLIEAIVKALSGIDTLSPVTCDYFYCHHSSCQ